MGAVLLLPRLRADQWAIVQHPAKVKAVCCGRRWGKSVMSGAVALSAASQGARVLWMVPEYKNARPIWRWSEAACGPLVRRGLVRLNRTERTIDFPGSGGYLGVYSADNDVAVRGDWFNLAILDEAARIAETTWTEVVQPALADAGGDAILPSTPAGENWFWREWQRGQAQMDSEIAAFTAPSSANPSPHIQRAAELAKKRVPANVYRQEWLAEFVAESTQIFLPGWWEATPEHEARRFDATDPAHGHRCVARWLSWDTAFTDTEGAAYTACVVGELTPDYRLFIREVWRDRVTFPSLMAKLHALAAHYNTDGKLQGIIIESKASGISAAQTLVETAEPWLSRLVLPFAPEGSKEHRAELAAVWCLQGCVWLPEPSASVPWLRAFEDELWSFPSSQNSDQVDSFSQLLLHVSRRLTQGREARERAALLAAQEQEAA
jgi:predicted phage terminase large subunit-like protein